MGHRRGIDHGVISGHRIHVQRIAQGHGDQIAMGQHHTLGAPGGAGGVEQPGQVGVLPQVRLHQLIARRPALHGQPGRGQFAAAGRQGRSVEASALIGVDQPGPGIAGNPGGFLGVQLAVDRNRHRPAPPDGIQQFEISAAVLHQQRHPVTRHNAVRVAQLQRAGPGLRGKRLVVGDLAAPLEQSRPPRPALGRIAQPMGDVHPQTLTACRTLA